MVTDVIAKGELDMTEAVVNQRSSEEELITELLTNALAQSRSTEGTGNHSPASGPVHHTGRLSMAWKSLSSSLLRPACLGGYRIFGRSMHRTLMLEVVGIGGHPGAGGSHCSIPHLKPDKQLLINSQPSRGRHSLKTRE
jgi:hypothetical protein